MVPHAMANGWLLFSSGPPLLLLRGTRDGRTCWCLRRFVGGRVIPKPLYCPPFALGEWLCFVLSGGR